MGTDYTDKMRRAKPDVSLRAENNDRGWRPNLGVFRALRTLAIMQDFLVCVGVVVNELAGRVDGPQNDDYYQKPRQHLEYAGGLHPDWSVFNDAVP
jgi:hypothetical protein